MTNHVPRRAALSTLAVAVVGCFVLTSSRADAQNAKAVSFEGKVVEVGQRNGEWYLAVLGPTGQTSPIVIDQKALDMRTRDEPAKLNRLTIDVLGEADASMLGSGVWVEFLAELDKNHQPSGKIGELTLISPPQDPDLPTLRPMFEGNGAGKGHTSTLVAGRLKTKLTNNKLRLQSFLERRKPVSINVEVAEDVKIDVRFSDLSFVSIDDKVSVTAFPLIPPRLLAQDISVQLKEKLTAAKPPERRRINRPTRGKESDEALFVDRLDDDAQGALLKDAVDKTARTSAGVKSRSRATKAGRPADKSSAHPAAEPDKTAAGDLPVAVAEKPPKRGTLIRLGKFTLDWNASDADAATPDRDNSSAGN